MKQKLKSIFTFTCPRCLHGKFFKHNPYYIKGAGDIYEHCACCGLKYEKEPGFYYGGMYVSYGLGVALFVSLWVSFDLFFPQASTALLIITIIGTVLILSPLMYALSKIIWANIFIKFDKEAYEKCRKNNIDPV